MNTKELSEELDNLPKDLKKPILAIINHETEIKMEKVLNKLDTVQSEIKGLNDKIMTTRYLIIGLGLLITILSFIFKMNS